MYDYVKKIYIPINGHMPEFPTFTSLRLRIWDLNSLQDSINYLLKKVLDLFGDIKFFRNVSDDRLYNFQQNNMPREKTLNEYEYLREVFGSLKRWFESEGIKSLSPQVVTHVKLQIDSLEHKLDELKKAIDEFYKNQRVDEDPYYYYFN